MGAQTDGTVPVNDYGIDMGDRARATSVASKTSENIVWVPDPILGAQFALLQVEPFTGLWVSRTRFPPGSVVQQHLHGGAVTAVTLSGTWGYPELNTYCKPGDFLIEQAGTVHSLQVVGDRMVDVIFIINGSIIYFDDSGAVERIEDWRSVLREYEIGCQSQGEPLSVLGWPEASDRTAVPPGSVE